MYCYIFLQLVIYNSFFSFTINIKDEIKVTSQISKKVEKRGDGRKIEFTSFTSNTTNGSNKTNRTILTTDQHREPVSSCSIVSSGTSLPNTTDLKTRHNLGNGKANKERIQEAYNIETDSPSARIETSVAEHPLETRFVITKIGY